jgi:hypothetical protein
MPISLHGVSYLTVAERLKAAHGTEPAPTGIQSIATECQVHGAALVVKATVTFASGAVFTGHSLVDFQATQPAERDAPLEVAETSAVGRALAMAGYPGSANGLAGAEEMRRVGQRQPGVATNGAARVNADLRPAASRPAARISDVDPVVYATADDAPHPADTQPRPLPMRPDDGNTPRATPKQLETLERLLKRAHRPPPDDLATMSRMAASNLITELAEGAPSR